MIALGIVINIGAAQHAAGMAGNAVFGAGLSCLMSFPCLWTVFFLLVFWLIWSLLSREDPLDIREIRRLRRCLQSARRSEDPFFYV